MKDRKKEKKKEKKNTTNNAFFKIEVMIIHLQWNNKGQVLQIVL